MTFHSAGNGNVIIPTDEVHDFSEGWLKTTNQMKNNGNFMEISPGKAIKTMGIFTGNIGN